MTSRVVVQAAAWRKPAAGLLFFFCLMSAALHGWDSFVLGHSVQGKEIRGWRFGQGGDCLVVAGGIHGAYESNSIQISAALIEHFKTAEDRLPITLYVVENLNPDGFHSSWHDPDTRKDASIIRFNANRVDLNRNWATPDWKPDVTYNDNDRRPGAGGADAMSEPEVQAFARFLLGLQDLYGICPVVMIHAYVFQNVEIGAAFPSYQLVRGKNRIDPLAGAMVKAFSATGEYSPHTEWDVYEVPGEFLHWAGRQGIPAIDLELGGLRNIRLPRDHGRPSHWDSFNLGFEALLDTMAAWHRH